mgnify:CR=1 FL=1
MNYSLDSKVAFITGAAGDLGSAFARALAEAGAKVVLADLNGQAAEEKAKALNLDGFDCAGVACDVTSEDAVNSAIHFAVEKYGSLDILVNAAALMKEIPTLNVLELDMNWWHKVMQVNLTGPLLCIRAATPYMKKAGQGKIINIASGGAFIPSGSYGVSKLGLTSLTATLAKELGPHNINVNNLAPGHMDTSSGHDARGENDALIVQALDHVVPLKTLGQAEDLLGGLLFLASSASDWITGQTLNIDGGWITRL